MITNKTYRCLRCGHRRLIDTNHYGDCYSLGTFNVCPVCPPFAKYDWLGGRTVWVCTEQPQDTTEESTNAGVA